MVFVKNLFSVLLNMSKLVTSSVELININKCNKKNDSKNCGNNVLDFYLDFGNVKTNFCFIVNETTTTQFAAFL